MAKMIISERFKLMPVEKQKLLKSFGYGVLALVALLLADYLQQFGLPERYALLAPFVPTVVNFLVKWAGEHEYRK